MHAEDIPDLDDDLNRAVPIVATGVEKEEEEVCLCLCVCLYVCVCVCDSPL
jgi:hypothetical protein